MPAITDRFVVYQYAGNYYFAGNGRWKQMSSSDYLYMTEMGQVNGVVAVSDATHWAAVTHSLGAPGGL